MSDGEEQAGPAASLLRSLVGLGGTLLAAAQTRVELLTTEISEDLERGVQLLLWAFVALLAGILGALLAGVTIIVYFWDSHRIAAAVCVTVAFLLLSAVAGVVFRSRLREKPRLLDATRTGAAARRFTAAERSVSSRLVGIAGATRSAPGGVRTASRRRAAALWRHYGPCRKGGPDDRYRSQLRARHRGWRDSRARGSGAGTRVESAAAWTFRRGLCEPGAAHPALRQSR